MRHVILSLLAVLSLSTQAAHAEEAQDISSDVEGAGRLDERVDADHARYGQWVFLGCVTSDYECQAIGARQGFRFRSVQQNQGYCRGGGYPGGYPGGWGGGGHHGPGGWGGGGHPGGYPGGYPGGWGGGGHPGGYPGGWGGGGHHRPGGWGGGGHHRPGGWGGGGHHRGRINHVAGHDSGESTDNNARVDGARTHVGRFAGFACFGGR